MEMLLNKRFAIRRMVLTLIPVNIKLHSFILVFIFSVFPGLCLAQFAGGDGTQDDPFQVATARQLYNVRNFLSAYFVQVADIDISHEELQGREWYDDVEGWQPIGIFSGHYNGTNHSITGMYINRSLGFLGLFSSIDGGTVKNVNLIDVDVTGHENFTRRIGALAGDVRYYSLISNCHSSGVVSGTGNEGTGGLIGRSFYSTIEEVSSSCDVNSVSRVGGVVGHLLGRSISNSFSNGDIFATQSAAGGLVGLTESATVTNSYSYSQVTSNGGSGGGLVGANQSESTIDNCYSTGNVFGSSGIGGLVGTNSNGSSVMNSYSTGDVVTTGEGNGGLVGLNRFSNSTIFNCYSTGNVKGSRNIGGLVGHNMTASIENSFSTGNAIGTDLDYSRIGGLVGYNDRSSINNCYSLGFVKGGRFMVGGLVGDNEQTATVSNSYWNIETSGWETSQGGDGAMGRTTTQMLQRINYVDWDIDDIWFIMQGFSYPGLIATEQIFYPIPGAANLTADIGNQSIFLSWNAPLNEPLGYRLYRDSLLLNEQELINDLYYEDNNLSNWEFYTYYVVSVYEVEDEELTSLPSLAITVSAVDFPGGDGSLENPFLVETAYDLHNIRYAPERNFLQIANIYLAEAPWNEGEGWLPIGSTDDSFTGSYDGARYIIEGLDINRPEMNEAGLFGFIHKAEIKNVGLIDVDITANNNVGALTGFYRDSIIEGCYSTGEIRGERFVGGIAGYSLEDSEMRNCYSTANINADRYAAGVIGANSASSVINCYSLGSLTANMYARGLIGWNFGNVTVRNSYWNIETSGTDTSAGGVGKTTAEMTYPYAEECYTDWDFDDVWRADDTFEINNGYPYLKWQVPTEPTIAVNPFPEDGALNVAIDLQELSWNYIADEAFLNPIGFRIYLNESGEFDTEDDFVWVDYIESQAEYFSSEILPPSLEYNTSYYWMVVPTMIEPEDDNGRGGNYLPERVRRQQKDGRMLLITTRGDAENCPVWSFTTVQEATGVEITMPLKTELFTNYPNPFNPSTTIGYSLQKESDIRLTIYNIKGMRVKILFKGRRTAGNHQISWDGTDENSKTVPSGVYLYRLQTEGYDNSSKMLMMK